GLNQWGSRAEPLSREGLGAPDRNPYILQAFHPAVGLVRVAAAHEAEASVGPTHAAELGLRDAEPGRHDLRSGRGAWRLARGAGTGQWGSVVVQVGGNRNEADVVVAVLRAEDADKAPATDQSARLIHIDHVHLVDQKIVSLEPVGRV